MRILGLLNSNVHGGPANLPREELFPSAMQAPLGKAIGEPVEVTARAIWPTPALPAAVAKWMDEVNPELVVFPIGSFWFLYESTPVRIERRLGGPGHWINRRAQRVAATPWLAHNSAFQWSRKKTQRALGGDAWFEPEDVVAVAKEVIRTVLRYEGSYLVVMGPGGGQKWAADDGARERLARRQELVDDALARFCAELKVEYWDRNRKKVELPPSGGSSLQGDDLHLDVEGHRQTASRYFEFSRAMVERALEHARPVISR